MMFCECAIAKNLSNKKTNFVTTKYFFMLLFGNCLPPL